MLKPVALFAPLIRSLSLLPSGLSRSGTFLSLTLLCTGCGEATTASTLSETPLPNLVNNSFTWGPIDYTVVSASLAESTQGSAIQLDLEAKNRIPYGTTSLLDWDLRLADGSQISQADNTWFNLETGQTQTFSVQFPIAHAPNLVGAVLSPHQANLNYAPAHIPLDQPLNEATVVLDALVGKAFSTPGTAERQWSLKVTSAQLGPNSDVDGGERALLGHQFVDVVFEIHYPATNSENAYFGADLAAVEVAGVPSYELFDSAILLPNQTGQVHFAFEIAHDATEFVLVVDTKDTAPQAVTVQLDQVLR